MQWLVKFPLSLRPHALVHPSYKLLEVEIDPYTVGHLRISRVLPRLCGFLPRRPPGCPDTLGAALPSGLTALRLCRGSGRRRSDGGGGGRPAAINMISYMSCISYIF